MSTFNSGRIVCEIFQLGSLEVNTYLVYEKNSDQAILIDPAEDSSIILNRLKELNFKDLTLFITHGHADHIAGIEFFKRQFPQAKTAISAADAPMLGDPDLNLSSFLGDELVAGKADLILKEGDILKTGNQAGTILEIPGHTPGGLALVFPEMVFSGDTLFAGSVGRSDFPGGNGKLLVNGIREKIFSLSDRKVFPGHGPESTIDVEKKTNPFFAAFFNL